MMKFFAILLVLVTLSSKAQNLALLQLDNTFNSSARIEGGKTVSFKSVTKLNPIHYYGAHINQGIQFQYKFRNWNFGILNYLDNWPEWKLNEIQPLVITLNYQFKFDELKLTIGSNIRKNAFYDRTIYLDFGIGLNFRNQKLSAHFANQIYFNRRVFFHDYEEIIYKPISAIRYSISKQIGAIVLEPRINVLMMHTYSYGAFDVLTSYNDWYLKFYKSTEKEWSALIGKSINRLELSLGYESRLQMGYLWLPFGIEKLENTHYLVLMLKYSV